MSNKTNLKYLFEVEYADGEVYKQTPDDKSKIDPEKRSEFYDVLQEVEKGRAIRKFSLVGNNNRISVDLNNGVFEINGVTFLAEGDKLPTYPEKFTLVFYRQWTHKMNVDYEVTKLGPVNITRRVANDPLCEYFIGWQCVLGKGKRKKNYQQKISVT